MNAFLETVKIIGVNRFIRVAYRLLTDGAAREMDFYHPVGEYSLVEATGAARGALGLPEDWIYSQSDLRRADAGDEVLTYHAVLHLVVDHQFPEVLEVAKERRPERQLEASSPSGL
jgi:hypothetical protein